MKNWSLSKKVVVADICNTLYDSNTTYDFIKYCIATDKLPAFTKMVYPCILSRVSPFFWAISLVQKAINKDIFKTIIVSFLKGHSIQDVKEWAEHFYEDVLQDRIIGQTFSILKEYNPDDIVLVSSTLEPIAATIAERLSIRHFLATTLVKNNSHYTGEIERELSGTKLAALQNKFQDGIELELVISDNFTDKELMSRSDKKIAVCYNKQHERYWSALPGVTILNITASNDRV